MMAQALPLEHVRVIDLTIARAGPTGVRQLADWGADVIRVEPPGGDAMSSVIPGGRLGSDFQNMHRNKRCVTLDLKREEGHGLLFKLLRGADVVVENFRPDVKHRLGIDYQSVRAVNPRIIYGSISGFGQEGPYRDRPGLDQIAQGMGGLMSVTGLPGQGPVRAGIAVADVAAGVFLAMGVLLALVERERSGQGQWVQTSLIEAMISFLDFQAARWLVEGEVPPQAGNHHPTGVPMGAFRASDGLVNLGAPATPVFRKLCEIIGAGDLADRPEYADSESRNRNRDALNADLEIYTSRMTRAEMVEKLTAAGIPCGPIYDIREVFEDPQVKHLGIAWPVEHPALGPIRLVGQPLQLSRTPHHGVRSLAPDAGEHNAEVFGELGIDAESLAKLRERGVI